MARNWVKILILATALAELGAPPQTIEQYITQAPTYWGEQPFLSDSTLFWCSFCFLVCAR